MMIDDGLHLLQPVTLSHDAVNQVRPIERPNQPFGIAKFQLSRNITSYVVGCSGGVGVYSHAGKSISQLSQHSVFRPKVVTPGTDAMSLIDRKERNVRRLEKIE